MGGILGVISHLLTIDPKFQREMQVEQLNWRTFRVAVRWENRIMLKPPTSSVVATQPNGRGLYTI